MIKRRSFLFPLCSAFVALTILVVPALAEELFGVLTKVDIAGSKVTVEEKDTNKEVEIKVTGDTIYETGKGEGKIDLEKIEKGIAKAKEKGRKGIGVVVTHEKGTASRIKSTFKKKDALNDGR